MFSTVHDLSEGLSAVRISPDKCSSSEGSWAFTDHGEVVWVIHVLLLLAIDTKSALNLAIVE